MRACTPIHYTPRLGFQIACGRFKHGNNDVTCKQCLTRIAKAEERMRQANGVAR